MRTFYGTEFSPPGHQSLRPRQSSFTTRPIAPSKGNHTNRRRRQSRGEWTIPSNQGQDIEVGDQIWVGRMSSSDRLYGLNLYTQDTGAPYIGSLGVFVDDGHFTGEELRKDCFGIDEDFNASLAWRRDLFWRLDYTDGGFRGADRGRPMWELMNWTMGVWDGEPPRWDSDPPRLRPGHHCAAGVVSSVSHYQSIHPHGI